jgi:hypothetical protein
MSYDIVFMARVSVVRYMLVIIGDVFLLKVYKKE